MNHRQSTQLFDNANDANARCAQLEHENRTLRLEVENLEKRLEILLEKTGQSDDDELRPNC